MHACNYAAPNPPFLRVEDAPMVQPSSRHALPPDIQITTLLTAPRFTSRPLGELLAHVAPGTSYQAHSPTGPAVNPSFVCGDALNAFEGELQTVRHARANATDTANVQDMLDVI